MPNSDRPQSVGINHVALAVDDIEAALDWYGKLFQIELRGRTSSGAFIDMGDQFIALSETDSASDATDTARHFGLVVDDLEAIHERLEELDIERLEGNSNDIRDPWGNRIQFVEYSEVQFTKADHILDGMDLDTEVRQKTDAALAELAEKGMRPD